MKTAIITITVFILIILGLYFIYNSSAIYNYSNEGKTNSLKNKSQEEQSYGIFSLYIKENLNSEEKDKILSILKLRDEKLKEIKKILEREFGKEDSNMAEAFEKVNEIRDEIKQSLLLFVASDRLYSFEEKYKELGAELESRYILK